MENISSHILFQALDQREPSLDILVPPVAADEAVGEVPVAHILGVVDRHYRPDGAAVDELLDLDDWREVPEDVTDGQVDPAALTGRRDLPTVGFGHRHRLLQQDVVAELGEGHGWSLQGERSTTGQNYNKLTGDY